MLVLNVNTVLSVRACLSVEEVAIYCEQKGGKIKKFATAYDRNIAALYKIEMREYCTYNK